MNIVKDLEHLGTSPRLSSSQVSKEIANYIGNIQANFFSLVKGEIEDLDLNRVV